MAGIPSKNMVVRVGNPSNTLTTISEANSASIATAVNELDVSHAGNQNMEYIPGQTSRTVSVGVVWNPTDDALFESIIGMADRDIEVFPDGNTSGKVKKAADCFITSYGEDLSLGSSGAMSLTFRITGALTRSTV